MKWIKEAREEARGIGLVLFTFGNTTDSDKAYIVLDEAGIERWYRKGNRNTICVEIEDKAKAIEVLNKENMIYEISFIQSEDPVEMEEVVEM